MERFYDGQVVTLEEIIRSDSWVLDSCNLFLHIHTYCNKEDTLGVSFYSTDENSMGTIFRID